MEQTEVVSHSNRPIAIVVALLSIAGLSYLLFSASGDQEAQPVPTTSTTTTSQPDSTAAEPVVGASLGPPSYQPEFDPWELNSSVFEMGEDFTVIASSFSADGDDSAPRLRRLAADGQSVLWLGEGRRDVDWQRQAPVLVQDTLLMLDDGGAIVAFDADTGSRRWVSQFRLVDDSFLTVLPLASEVVVLAQTEALGLVRVTAASGAPFWSVPEVEAVGRSIQPDGSESVLVATSDGQRQVDAQTGEFITEPEEFWWTNFLEPGEADARVVSLGEGVVVLLTSNRDGDELRAPRIRGLDLQRKEVRWVAEGLDGSQWQPVNPILVDGVVIIPDLPEDLTLEPSLLHGFDGQTGELLWVWLFGNNMEIVAGRFATVLFLDGEPILLLRTKSGQIRRIDPRRGITLWEVDAPVGQLRSVRSNPDGGWTIGIEGPGSVILDPENGLVVDEP